MKMNVPNTPDPSTTPAYDVKIIGGKRVVLKRDERSDQRRLLVNNLMLDPDQNSRHILPPIEHQQEPATTKNQVEPNIRLWRELHKMLLFYDRHQFTHMIMDFEQKVVVNLPTLLSITSRYDLPIHPHLLRVLAERFVNFDPPNSINYQLLVNYLINCQSPPPPHGHLSRNPLPVPEMTFTLNNINQETQSGQQIDVLIRVTNKLSEELNKPRVQSRSPVLPLEPLSQEQVSRGPPEDEPLNKPNWIKRFDKMAEVVVKIPQKKPGYLDHNDVVKFIEPYDLVYNLQLFLTELKPTSHLVQVAQFLQQIKDAHLTKNYKDVLELGRPKRKLRERPQSTPIPRSPLTE